MYTKGCTATHDQMHVCVCVCVTRPPSCTQQVAWWRYALLSIADVEANYFVVLAYQYTSITSVMLIDCFTIPCVMLLSRCFLHVKVQFRLVACPSPTITLTVCSASFTALSPFPVWKASLHWSHTVPGWPRRPSRL